jgi:hypothetical protein
MDSILIPSHNGFLKIELKLIGKTPGEKIDNALLFVESVLKAGDEIRITYTYKGRGGMKVTLPPQGLAGEENAHASSG